MESIGRCLTGAGSRQVAGARKQDSSLSCSRLAVRVLEIAVIMNSEEMLAAALMGSEHAKTRMLFIIGYYA